MLSRVTSTGWIQVGSLSASRVSPTGWVQFALGSAPAAGFKHSRLLLGIG